MVVSSSEHVTPIERSSPRRTPRVGWSGLAANVSLDLAVVLDGLADYELATKAYAEARRRRLAYFGEGHPQVAYADLNLALFEIDVGDEQRARQLLG